jgi:hypothetical protein
MLTRRLESDHARDNVAAIWLLIVVLLLVTVYATLAFLEKVAV